ncbi:MAG TPA: beta-ketoacyl synthase N-terminal-like domain-containing protein, partial [Phycisphaerae bacterium]|nr:beta-ketoacyl synthase N-terminal-like domain-containing protein [Phycisphaerae bacterium]
MDRREGGERLAAMKKAIVEIRALRGRLAEAERRSTEPIAIVGCALRFPGAADVDAYWSLLSGGVDAIREIPRDRWDVDAFYDPDPDAPGKMYTRSGGFLPEIDRFDARFFGISPREAASMDPQHRLLLEVAWEALEDAGISAESLSGTPTGVYIGISNSDYGRMVLSDPARIDTYASIGTSYSVIAGRLSYLLGLQGPSLAVDTACSSSLVAVHLAVQSLRSGESRLAIAGGSNLMISPEVNVNFCKARMLAPDGKCKTFDAGADGYVRGEGCGVVVLKRLSDALDEGDCIRAVVRGSAVNQDGRSSGLTAPNGPSQEAVIRAALANAGLKPADVDYVEAHGTGTSLGDPIEVGALGAALCAKRPTDRPLGIGSVKTNIGHLEASAGVAGLIKVILALERETIPPQLHFRVPNPHIDWARWPVEVVTEAKPWLRGEHRRVAGVSSFGFSGTNAHLVVEEPPLPSPVNAIVRPWHLVTLSAKTSTALGNAAGRLASRLQETRELELGDVSLAANAGKTHFAERAAVLAETVEGASDSLRRLAEGGGGPEIFRGRVDAGG